MYTGGPLVAVVTGEVVGLAADFSIGSWKKQNVTDRKSIGDIIVEPLPPPPLSLIVEDESTMSSLGCLNQIEYSKK